MCAFFLSGKRSGAEEYLHQSMSLELLISNKTLGKTTPISQGSLGISSVSKVVQGITFYEQYMHVRALLSHGPKRNDFIA